MANEAEERERQRVLDLVNEDLRKEIPALLTDVHQESIRYKDPAIWPVTRTLARFASLLGALYIKTDIQTRRVIGLTRAIVWLTVALLGFTAYLSYDAYLNDQRAKKARKDQTEKHESNIERHPSPSVEPKSSPAD